MPRAIAARFGIGMDGLVRLGLVRAWTALGDRDRARGELDRLHRLAPGLADLAAARDGL